MEANSLDNYTWIAPVDHKLEKKDQTVWTLSGLTYEQDIWIENNTDVLPQGDILNAILQMGLQGVANLKSNGSEVEFEKDSKTKVSFPLEGLPWSSVSLSRIPSLVRATICKQIRWGSQLDENELKN